MGKWQVLAQRVLHAFHIRADVFRGRGAVGENHVGVGHEHHRDDDILAQFADEIKDFINEKYDGAVIPFEDSADEAESETEVASEEATEAATEAVTE